MRLSTNWKKSLARKRFCKSLPGTRFLCKKPVPEPSGKNSKLAGGTTTVIPADAGGHLDRIKYGMTGSRCPQKLLHGRRNHKCGRRSRGRRGRGDWRVALLPPPFLKGDTGGFFRHSCGGRNPDPYSRVRCNLLRRLLLLPNLPVSLDTLATNYYAAKDNVGTLFFRH
jgi:hypothetical protein